MKTLKSFASLLMLFAAAVTFTQITGCDENGGITIPSGVSELTVSVKSDDNIQDNLPSIAITEAKALISQVEFEKQSNGRNELHLRGPFVIVLNLNGGLTEMGSQFIIRDFYTKIKFQIHKPEDNETPPTPSLRWGQAETRDSRLLSKVLIMEAALFTSRNNRLTLS